MIRLHHNCAAILQVSKRNVSTGPAEANLHWSGLSAHVLESEGFVPANTEANTEWAIRNFEAWADWQIAQNPDDPVPSDILSCGDAVALNNLVVAFFVRD